MIRQYDKENRNTYPAIIERPPKGVTGPKNLNFSLFNTNANIEPENTKDPAKIAGPANFDFDARGCKLVAIKAKPLNTA